MVAVHAQGVAAEVVNMHAAAHAPGQHGDVDVSADDVAADAE